MKTTLRCLIVLIALCYAGSKIYSQCTVTKATIQNLSKIPYGSSSCIITFDYSFQIQNSTNNHIIYIHSWLQSQYPNYFNCLLTGNGGPGVTQAPTQTNLENAFINIGIKNNGGNAPLILTTYNPDPSVPMTPVN